jgi:hypothetical protein
MKARTAGIPMAVILLWITLLEFAPKHATWPTVAIAFSKNSLNQYVNTLKT